MHHFHFLSELICVLNRIEQFLDVQQNENYIWDEFSPEIFFLVFLSEDHLLFWIFRPALFHDHTQNQMTNRFLQILIFIISTNKIQPADFQYFQKVFTY